MSNPQTPGGEALPKLISFMQKFYKLKLFMQNMKIGIDAADFNGARALLRALETTQQI
ncbi:MAG: hypothetical protein ACPGKS_01000 [Coraliomargarita sp.]